MSFFDSMFGGGGRKAAGQANEAYEAWMQKAIDEYRSSEAQGRSDLLGMTEPYRKAGGEALSAYEGTLGLPGGEDRQSAINQFRATTGYKFAMQQGTQALQRQGAATGLSGSGAESRELTRYGQGVADQEYGGYQNRLSGLASFGGQMSQQTGSSLAQLGQGYARDIGGAYGSLGKGEADSIMAGYSADQSRNAAIWGALGKLGGSAIGAWGHPGGMGGI